jgi:hypothetical protein
MSALIHISVLACASLPGPFHGQWTLVSGALCLRLLNFVTADLFMIPCLYRMDAHVFLPMCLCVAVSICRYAGGTSCAAASERCWRRWRPGRHKAAAAHHPALHSPPVLVQPTLQQCRSAGEVFFYGSGRVPTTQCIPPMSYNNVGKRKGRRGGYASVHGRSRAPPLPLLPWGRA